MDKNAIDSFISDERFNPYLKKQSNNYSKALLLYNFNILISEAFYPIISILEIALRNKVHFILSEKYNRTDWYDSSSFKEVALQYHLLEIEKAKKILARKKKKLTSGQVISELSLGFWTAFFNARLESIFWKDLRVIFKNCPKQIRKRKAISSRLNGIKKLRNRISHHEPIAWDYGVLWSYDKKCNDILLWFDKDLYKWANELSKIESILSNNKNLFS